MNATKLIIAAGFAIATAGALAETGVGTYQIDDVANVYGRAGGPNVKTWSNSAVAKPWQQALGERSPEPKT